MRWVEDLMSKLKTCLVCGPQAKYLVSDILSRGVLQAKNYSLCPQLFQNIIL